jgi:hypothetical protein
MMPEDRQLVQLLEMRCAWKACPRLLIFTNDSSISHLGFSQKLAEVVAILNKMFDERGRPLGDLFIL